MTILVSRLVTCQPADVTERKGQTMTTTLFTAHGGRDPDAPPTRPADPAETPDVGHRSVTARVVWFIVRWVANLAMVVLIATFTLVAILPATGARAMIVLSGSMEPLLSAGDAAIIRDVPAQQLEVGDVITFQGIGVDTGLTTHRIIQRIPLDSGLHFQTQGDGNEAPDVNLAPARNVVGRYEGMIPYGGRALLALSSREAKIALVALPALLILVGEIRSLIAAAAQRYGPGSPTRPRTVAVGIAALTLAAIAGVAATTATMAMLTDAATITDNTLSTADTF